jgi:hypothetical protein
MGCSTNRDASVLPRRERIKQLAKCVNLFASRTKKAGARFGPRPSAEAAYLPLMGKLRLCYWTVTLEQLAVASLLASTMHQSPPLPPEAVSKVSPSATLILS